MLKITHWSIQDLCFDHPLEIHYNNPMYLKLLPFILVFSAIGGHSQAFVCDNYEKFKASGINQVALDQALYFFQQNQEKHNLKSDYLIIADYSLSSEKKRFYILNLQTGEVTAERVSHGSGKVTLYRQADSEEKMMYVERLNGEKSHDGMFNKCRISQDDLARINANRTRYNRRALHYRENLTRPGFFKTAEPYISASHIKENRPAGRHHWWPITTSGHNGIRLDGLSTGVNDRARNDGVVMHEATYNVKYAAIMGRSYGCPAFEKGILKKHIDKIKKGRLYYSYVPQCKEDIEIIINDLQGAAKVCTK